MWDLTPILDIASTQSGEKTAERIVMLVTRTRDQRNTDIHIFNVSFYDMGWLFTGPIWALIGHYYSRCKSCNSTVSGFRIFLFQNQTLDKNNTNYFRFTFQLLILF